MTSPAAALLWEIWRKHRWTVAAIAAVTAAGNLVDFLDAAGRASDAVAESSPLPTLLAMIAFVLLLGVFNYTESTGNRGLGQFPRRMFTLPVTSLRLVAVPMLAGIASIELLYALWRVPLSRHGSASPLFVGVLLAALIVFYLWTLWALARAGALRLFMLGVITVALFVAGMLPSFEPTPPPLWRSESGLAAIVSALSAVAFLLTWRHVRGLRAGGPGAALREWPSGLVTRRTRARSKPFSTSAAAQFWFEWRASGMVLPGLVAGTLFAVILPTSWLVRGNDGDTFRLFLAALAAPIILAVPVGIAFSKPTFWSEDLALPAFVAIRPLGSADLVAIKVKVAAASAAMSWIVVLACLAVWLPAWGNLDALSRLGIQLWALNGQSVVAVFGISALVALAGMFLTWRFLVSRLWSGLFGKRPLFVASVLSLVVLVITGLVTDASRFPAWLFAEPARLGPVAWIAAAAVVAKFWIAAYTWRAASWRDRRNYFLLWLAATASVLAFGLLAWGIARLYVPLDTDRLQGVVILLALLAIPLARVGLAPASLARNRHK